MYFPEWSKASKFGWSKVEKSGKWSPYIESVAPMHILGKCENQTGENPLFVIGIPLIVMGKCVNPLGVIVKCGDPLAGIGQCVKPEILQK